MKLSVETVFRRGQLSTGWKPRPKDKVGLLLVGSPGRRWQPETRAAEQADHSPTGWPSAEHAAGGTVRRRLHHTVLIHWPEAGSAIDICMAAAYLEAEANRSR